MIVLSTKKKRRWISHRTHRTHALHDGRRTHAIMSSTTWGGQCFVASCRLGHRRSTVRPPHPPTWHNPRRRWGHATLAPGDLTSVARRGLRRAPPPAPRTASRSATSLSLTWRGAAAGRSPVACWRRDVAGRGSESLCRVGCG